MKQVSAFDASLYGHIVTHKKFWYDPVGKKQCSPEYNICVGGIVKADRAGPNEL